MARRTSRKFTPYRPPTPPAGSYDPSLDSQLAAARRGLSDLQGQIGTQQARDVTDYAVSQQDLGRQYAQGREDLLTARDRGVQDYDRNVRMLQRNYDNLNVSQIEGANAANVISGGALLQAQAKRQANINFDKEPLDTNYQRFLHDNAQSLGRLDTATQSQMGRMALDYAPPDAGNPLGGRRYQDRNTQLVQAQREQAFFGQDVGNMKAFQAAGAGWDPPQRPANEFVSRAGVPYQVRGGVRYDQLGRRLGRATGRGF